MGLRVTYRLGAALETGAATALTSHFRRTNPFTDFHVLGAVSSLQPPAGVVLRDTCSQLASGLEAAAAAVGSLSDEDLAEAVEAAGEERELVAPGGQLQGGAGAGAGGGAAESEELVALRTAVLRVHVMLVG